jgi:hypothetical protein
MYDDLLYVYLNEDKYCYGIYNDYLNNKVWKPDRNEYVPSWFNNNILTFLLSIRRIRVVMTKQLIYYIINKVLIK